MILETIAEIEAVNAKLHESLLKQCALLHCSGDSPESPCLVGRSYRFNRVSFKGNGGGSKLVRGSILAKVEAAWWDHETGWHYACVIENVGRALLDPLTGREERRESLPKYARASEFDLARGAKADGVPLGP